MTAYLIANYDVSDPDAYNGYVAAVVPIIAAHGGEILVAGPGSRAIEGRPGAVTVVLKFPSMEALEGWYDSPEYQQIIRLRTDHSAGHLIFAEQFQMPQ